MYSNKAQQISVTIQLPLLFLNNKKTNYNYKYFCAAFFFFIIIIILFPEITQPL